MKPSTKFPSKRDISRLFQSMENDIEELSEVSGNVDIVVNNHNVSKEAHNDIRLLIKELADGLNALADSDDTTLDQLSEIVAYIKTNKELIDAVTTAKVNVTDIVDNLFTNVADKPLSAAQGVALKQLIDAIPVSGDYVVESGTSGIWSYQKWYSGTVDCWGVYTNTFQHYTEGTSTLYGYAYTQTIAYPFLITDAIPLASVGYGNGFSVVTKVVHQLDSATNKVQIIFDANIAGGASGSIFIFVKGRWK